MNFNCLKFAVCMGLLTSPVMGQELTSLFDGKTLSGWTSEEKHIWYIEDGAITGGFLDRMIEENTFLVSENSYQNFDLTLKVRLLGTEGFINSGFQIRSMPVDGNSEMSGYQVDAGDEWWGKLYDESRRDKVIAESADMKTIDQSIMRGDWNEYRILCEGRRIRSWINGIPSLDYEEKDLGIPQNGHIAIQVHSGGKTKVQVKDIHIKVLEDSPSIPTWEQTGMPVYIPK